MTAATPSLEAPTGSGTPVTTVISTPVVPMPAPTASGVPLATAMVTFVGPTSPLLQTRGRIDRSTDPNAARMAYAGTAFGARFTGTRLSVTLSEESFSSSYLGSDSFDIVLDGGNSIVVHTTPTAAQTVVADGLSDGVHTVWAIKRTDPSVGVSRFYGFEVDSQGTFLTAPQTSTRRLEFIGASALAGYGVYTQGDLCNGLNAESCDALLSYPQMAGAILGADVSSYVYSGKGVYVNITPGDTVKTLPYMYQRTIPDDQNAPLRDFTEAPPQAIVIDAGGVDFQANTALDAATFGTAYYQLVRKVRSLNPQALIFCTRDSQDGSDFNDAYTQGITYAVQQSNAVDNDAYVFYYAFPAYPDAAGLGCNGHPSIAGATASAQNIAAVLKARLMW